MHFLIFLQIFAAATIFIGVEAAQYARCDQVHLNQYVPRWYSDGAIVFNFSLDISFTSVDEWNTMVTLRNFESSSANDSLYYQTKPIRYNTYGEQKVPYIYCPTMKGECNLTIFNAAGGFMELPLYMAGYSYDDYTESILSGLIFDSGTLIDNIFGAVFNQGTYTCQTITQSTVAGTNIYIQYCCTHWSYVTIPDKMPPECVQFESSNTFTDENGAFSSSFNIQYALTSIGMEYSINPLQLPPNFPFYAFQPNRGFTNFQNDSFPMTYFGSGPVDSTSDFQLDMDISVQTYWNPERKYAGIATIGRILRRKGMLLKDLNTPYTPEAPCKQVNPPFYGGRLSKSNFCCKKFRALDDAQSCAEYRSFTKVYYAAYKGIYLDVRYKFNGTAMIVSILSYGNPVVSTMQVESYSTDTFSQTCKVSTTSPQNTCVFKLSATNQYQLLFRTSENRDGINMTSLYASGTQIFDPNLSPSKPCKAWYRFSNTNSNYGDRAVTELCCISQPGGEWPGALNSFGYPNPFGDNHFPLQKQERQIVDKTYITTSKHM